MYGIELLQLDPEAAGDEEPADRRGGDSLAEGRDDSPGDEEEAGIACGNSNAQTGIRV